MKKLIVTCDFSVNSTAGIRFAIQLASQHPAQLVFLHVIELTVPVKWNDIKAKIRADAEITRTEERLRQFVSTVYRDARVRPKTIDCVVRYGAPVSETIVEVANERKADYLCMSTRGAGRLRRIIGTHTSAALRCSPLPVFAIPRNYRRTAVRHILYASDLSALAQELKKVRQIAALLQAKVSVLHYDYFIELKESREDFEKVTRRYQSSDVEFHLQQFDLEQSLASHLKKAIRKYRPELIVLFTHPHRNWFQRVLLGSRSADISYDTRKPLLVFPREAPRR